ncbi:MAG: hypothetical protein KJ052_08870, partial [Candidatus Hydrogenedentes bacterium]|nr:hypothetical protein [Candidatus Hydrogenedentota bacterium]
MSSDVFIYIHEAANKKRDDERVFAVAETHEARITSNFPKLWAPLLGATVFVVAAILIYTLCLMYAPVKIPDPLSDLDKTAKFSDSFNALNSLFSGLAFAVLAVSLIFQRYELKASLEELRRSVQYQAQLAETAKQDLAENLLQMRANLFAVSEEAFVPLEQSLMNVPSALRFHGIAPEELESHGLTIEEFAYLAATLTAGGIHIKATNIRSPGQIDEAAFPQSSYYYNLLKTPAVRSAWPLMTRMISES